MSIKTGCKYVGFIDPWTDLGAADRRGNRAVQGLCHLSPRRGRDVVLSLRHGVLQEADRRERLLLEGQEEGRMSATELLPCPFCGYKGVYFRRKSDTRESVTGAMADIAQEWGPSYEAHVSDWRFGVKLYCGRCRASTGYQWGEWHVPTESEIECYGDIAFRIPNQYDNYEHKDEVEADAVAAWNRRAER